ncbi:hypothetical protein ACTFIY_001279 [Dictyostelium cf. discoideum]
MSVDSVYKYIVFDVIRNIKSNIKNDSDTENVDESIIDEIQTMWLDRLTQTGAISNQNDPDETTATTTTTTQPQSTLSTVEQENVRNTLNSLIQLNNKSQTTTTTTTSTFGNPQQYLPPQKEVSNGTSPTMNSSNGSNNNNNSSNSSNNNLPSSLRSIMNPMPQNDGTLDESDNDDDNNNNDNENNKDNIDKLIIDGFKKNFNFNGDEVIPQNDGLNDDDDLDDEEIGGGGGKVEEDSLGSDLDDDDDDDPDPIIEHFVLCQYEKVSRIKNKRKCNFKDGIMHLNGKDTLFNKANGEMIWN